jgi:hypothetical protein
MSAYIEVDHGERSPPFADPVKAHHLTEGSFTFGKDYETLFAKRYPTCYHVEDTWANFDLVAEMIDKRFAKWKARHGGSPAE